MIIKFLRSLLKSLPWCRSYNLHVDSRVPQQSPVLIFLVPAMITPLILLQVTWLTGYLSRYASDNVVIKNSRVIYCKNREVFSLFLFDIAPPLKTKTYNVLITSILLLMYSFQAQQDISSLKNIAGETGKKLSSLASNLMTDLQDRILWFGLKKMSNEFVTIPANICVVECKMSRL